MRILYQARTGFPIEKYPSKEDPSSKPPAAPNAFYKTRALAVDEIGKGRVLVNGQAAKPAREVGPGDRVSVRKSDPPIEVVVQGVSRVRGPAPVAATLYQETEESAARRARAAEMRRLAPEPSLDYDAGRPTKRDRRILAAIRGK